MTEINKISAHAESIEAVERDMDTSIESGLSGSEVTTRLEKYGKNELVKEKGKTALQIFISQFKDFLIYLLFFAIAVSVLIGVYEAISNPSEPWSTEYTDAIVIASILVVNAILGFYQEYQAEKSMESLRKMAPHFAKVRRNNQVKEIAVEDVVLYHPLLLKQCLLVQHLQLRFILLNYFS
jgi:Ca2+-transporting ATPase